MPLDRTAAPLNSRRPFWHPRHISYIRCRYHELSIPRSSACKVDTRGCPLCLLWCGDALAALILINAQTTHNTQRCSHQGGITVLGVIDGIQSIYNMVLISLAHGYPVCPRAVCDYRMLPFCDLPYLLLGSLTSLIHSHRQN